MCSTPKPRRKDSLGPRYTGMSIALMRRFSEVADAADERRQARAQEMSSAVCGALLNHADALSVEACDVIPSTEPSQERPERRHRKVSTRILPFDPTLCDA